MEAKITISEKERLILLKRLGENKLDNSEMGNLLKSLDKKLFNLNPAHFRKPDSINYTYNLEGISLIEINWISDVLKENTSVWIFENDFNWDHWVNTDAEEMRLDNVVDKAADEIGIAKENMINCIRELANCLKIGKRISEPYIKEAEKAFREKVMEKISQTF